MMTLPNGPARPAAYERTELHQHVDGSIPLPVIWQMMVEHGLNPVKTEEEMKKLVFVAVCLITALVISSLPSDLLAAKSAGRVPAGRVAWHFVSRIQFTATGADLFGYLTFIDGLPEPFFNGPAGEGTAFFTVRLTGGPAPTFVTPGGDVDVTLIGPGATFDVFFDPSPNQDWSDPDTFSDGQLIGTFEESHFMGTAIGPSGFNLFSSDLVSSHRFRFQGTRQDLGSIVPFGVTINNTGSNTPISFTPVTIPFTGSAVAIGSTDDDDDDDVRRRRLDLQRPGVQ